MKGVFLQEGAEYRLEISGDCFAQGDAIPCTLTVKNHAPAPRPVSALRLSLALGSAKKVKEKAADAFQVISSFDLSQAFELAAHGQQSFPASFKLDRNAPVSDKNQSLYVLVGTPDSAWTYGQLPIGIEPHPYLLSVAETLDTVFQFVHKGVSSKGGWTTFKMKPPSSRRLTLVDELNLSMRFDEKVLELKFDFTVKKFETGAVKLDVKKGKVEVAQRWEPEDYLFGGSYIQQPYVETSIDAALATVSSGL